MIKYPEYCEMPKEGWIHTCSICEFQKTANIRKIHKSKYIVCRNCNSIIDSQNYNSEDEYIKMILSIYEEIVEEETPICQLG